MKKLLLVVSALLCGIAFGYIGFTSAAGEKPTVTPRATKIPRPLDAYTIDALSKRKYTGEIVFEEPVREADAYTVRPFYFFSDGKKVTGLSHIPVSEKEKYPVIVQLRGYIDRTIYQSGMGTAHSAEVYASNGFISLSPDFLGYGESDVSGGDIFEDRFSTYVVAMNLLASVSSIPQADTEHIFFWGHSNGGHIALTVLEICKFSLCPKAATLWAPVTKPFPYSILYYTDEADDGGKYLRRELSKFEDLYDTDKYSLALYLDHIDTPLMIHQGSADDAIPQEWTDGFVSKLRELDKDVTYYVYPEADHDMNGSWDTVVGRDMEFFGSFLRF